MTGNAAYGAAGGAYSGTLINCVINGNWAYGSGGGAQQSTLVNCLLVSNVVTSAGSGPGVGADNCLLLNCLLVGNQCGYAGGGAGGSTLINCTIVSNTAGAYDGGVSGCTVRNSIVYYNFDYNTTPDVGSGNFTNCCLFPAVSSGANNFTNPPAFVNLAAGDFHLSPSSPCINAGNNSFITNSTDLDGNPRIVGGIVDIGAYEFQSPLHFVALNSTNPVSPYTNWLAAATNIQDAVDVASAGDFIVVSNGTYNTGGRVAYGNSTNRVVINKAVTVQSVNGPATTIIAGIYSGNASIRCVYLTNNAALIGFTLKNGAAIVSGDVLREQSGGGVWCESSAVVSNCIIGGNVAQNEYGGGAFQGTFFNCTFTNNSASYGGGAASNTLFCCSLMRNSSMYQNFNYGGGAYGCTLSNSQIVGNQSVAGGGNGAGAAFSTLLGCTISNNVAGASGGGVFMSIANNSLVSSNRASYGGGAFSNFLSNCVLERNVAVGDGGGAYNSALVNCTVVSNISIAGASGGILGGNATNSIVYYNLAPQGGPNFFNSAMNYCDTTPLPAGSGKITNEPAFVNLAGGDFHLQTNSPCINSGNNASVVSTNDLDGNPRVSGGTVDIGAYEFQNPASVISYAWLQQYGLPTDGSVDYADLDGTGMNNWQKWIAGLNPLDPTSVLVMLPPVSTNSSSGLIVAWQSVTNRTYFLQRATDLLAQPAFSAIQSNLVGQAGTTSYTDTSATNGGPYFYRAGVQ
jgi:hypothetical protein